MRPQLTRGQALDLPDGRYAVSGVVGAAVRLRRESDGYEHVMDLAEVPLMLAEPLMFRDARFDPALLSTLERWERKLVKYRLRAVRQALGLLDEDDPVYADFHPKETTFRQRVALAAERLQAAEQVGGESTIREWVAKYRANGILGLRELRSNRVKQLYGETDGRVIDAIEEIWRERRENSDLTDLALVRLAADRARQNHERRSRDNNATPVDPPIIPGERTMLRRLHTVKEQAHAQGTARRRHSMGKVPTRGFHRRPVLFPGEEVQCDTSPFDLLCLDDKGRVCRAKLTIMLDIGTRLIIGMNVTLGAPTGQQHASMFIASMTTRTVSVGPELPWMIDVAQFPWGQGMSREQVRAAVLSQPYVATNRLVVDNAKDNASHVLQATVDQFGTDLTFTNPATPTDKPEVERTFGSIWSQLLQHLPGYIASSTEHRGRDIDTTQLLHISTLAALLQAWIAIVWTNRPHPGLQHPVLPGVTLTPREMWEAQYDRTGAIPVPLSADEYISFLPHERLKLRPEGFKLKRRPYDSGLLDDYRRKVCPYTPDGLWPVHYDALNPTTAWVRNPQKGPGHPIWIVLQTDPRRFWQQPFSKSVRTSIHHAVQRRGAQGDPETIHEIAASVAATDTAVEHEEREHDRLDTNRSLAQQLGHQLTVDPTDPAPLFFDPYDDQPENGPEAQNEGAEAVTLFNPEEETWGPTFRSGR